MEASRSRRLYAFGDFTFDPVAGVLMRHDRRIPLAHQPAKVLDLPQGNQSRPGVSSKRRL